MEVLHIAPHISKEDDREDRKKGEKLGELEQRVSRVAQLVEEGLYAVAFGKQTGE